MSVDNKSERQKRRTERQQPKIDEYKASLGSNETIDIGPLSSDRKAAIDKRMDAYAQDDQRESLKRFQQRVKAPDIKGPVKPEQDVTIKDVRRAKRAHIADILGSLSKGMSGQKVDPTMYRDKLKTGKQAQYQQYKEASIAAKNQRDKWGAGYAQQQIDYLEGLKKDTGMSALKKEKIQAEINKLNAETKFKKNQPYYKPSTSTKVKPIYTHQTEEGNWNITNQKNPYSDLYYKLTGNSPTIINEIAKLAGNAIDDSGALKRNLSVAETERLSNTLLSKAFDIQIDENGNQVAIPKTGKENFMQDISSFMTSTNKLKVERQRLQQELEDELFNVTDPWGPKNKDSERERINAEYESVISEADLKLKELETKLQSMLSGDYTSEAPPKKETPPTTGKSPLDDIYNS